MNRPGRPRGSLDPRLPLDEARALLLARGATPTAIAAALGVHRQAVDRALRVGLTVRLAKRWGLVCHHAPTCPGCVGEKASSLASGVDPNGSVG